MVGPFFSVAEIPKAAPAHAWLYVAKFSDVAKVGMTVRGARKRIAEHLAPSGRASGQQLIAAYVFDRPDAMHVEFLVRGLVRDGTAGWEWFSPALFPLAVAIAQDPKRATECAGVLMSALAVVDAIRPDPPADAESVPA